MELSEFFENLNSKKLPVFKLGFLIVSLIFVNYVAKFTLLSGSANLIVFVIFEIALLIIDPFYAFIYAFVQHVDIFECYHFTWSKFLTVVCMFYVFIRDTKSIYELFEDKKLKTIFYLALLFGFYVIIFNIGLKSTLNLKNITDNAGFIFGFLTILPAYYYTLKRPQDLFVSLTVVSASFIIIYYISLIKGLGLFKLENAERHTGADIERLAGYDVRQFIIFFTYLIPAFVLTSKIKTIYKYILIFIGIFSFVILIFAFYRLAMFYVTMGTILSFIFIRRYAKKINLLKISFLAITFYLIANFFLGNYLTEVNKLFFATLDYFEGKGNDSSADSRIEYQIPILTGFINSNFWTGKGISEIESLVEIGELNLMVDIPILGTLAAFGVIGMFLYYLRYIVLLTGTTRNFKTLNRAIINEYPFMFYLFLTLKAYIITMVTFRFFYISWELTMVTQQAEFGLFAGVFLALNYVFKNYEQE